MEFIYTSQNKQKKAVAFARIHQLASAGNFVFAYFDSQYFE